MAVGIEKMISQMVDAAEVLAATGVWTIELGFGALAAYFTGHRGDEDGDHARLTNDGGSVHLVAH